MKVGSLQPPLFWAELICLLPTLNLVNSITCFDVIYYESNNEWCEFLMFTFCVIPCWNMLINLHNRALH